MRLHANAHERYLAQATASVLIKGRRRRDAQLSGTPEAGSGTVILQEINKLLAEELKQP